MTQIIKLSILCLFLFSCGNRNYNKEHAVVFLLNDYIKYRLDSNILSIDYLGLHYKDTLILKNDEETKIIISFEKNKIYDVKGEITYATNGYLVMPPAGLKIQLHNKTKLQSEIFIEYDYPTEKLWPISQKNRTLNFRKDVLKIFSANLKFKKAKDALSKYQNDSKVINL